MNDPLPTCESLSEAISLLAAGCLDAAEEHQLQQHLASCQPCRERLEQLRAVCSGLEAARSDEPPMAADVVARAVVEIEASAASPARRPDLQRRGSPHWVRWTLLAAAVAASVVVFMRAPDWFRVPPDEPKFVQQVGPQRKTDDGDTLQEAQPTAGPPSWLELKQAFAESDEALEMLLARGSNSSETRQGDTRVTPLDTRSLLEEI